MKKGRDLKEEEAQITSCLGDLLHTLEKDTREKSSARAAPDLPVTQHTPSRKSTQWHNRTQNVSCSEVGCPCETAFIQQTQGVYVACQQALAPGSAEWQGECRCGMYVCVLLACACEAVKWEDIRLVGWLLFPRDLGTVEDRVGLGVCTTVCWFSGILPKDT